MLTDYLILTNYNRAVGVRSLTSGHEMVELGWTAHEICQWREWTTDIHDGHFCSECKYESSEDKEVIRINLRCSELAETRRELTEKLEKRVDSKQ